MTATQTQRKIQKRMRWRFPWMSALATDCPRDCGAHFAQRLSKTAASILPGAVLLFLPKCPLCLAVWLTAVTGVGFSVAGAAWTSAIVVVLWIAAVGLVAMPIRRRRSLGHAQSSTSVDPEKIAA